LQASARQKLAETRSGFNTRAERILLYQAFLLQVRMQAVFFYLPQFHVIPYLHTVRGVLKKFSLGRCA
jgi:hypothetical protein